MVASGCVFVAFCLIIALILIARRFQNACKTLTSEENSFQYIRTNLIMVVLFFEVFVATGTFVQVWFILAMIFLIAILNKYMCIHNL